MKRQDVRFGPAGETCAAVHYTADDEPSQAGRGRPCVVMAHGFAATRSSGLDAFAEAFCRAGADVVAFDYRHFGASDGKPREHVSARRQVEDYRRAVAYARVLDGVDPDLIVLWGTSFAGGHVLDVAARDQRIGAVIALTPAPDGWASAAAAIRSRGPRAAARLAVEGIRDVTAALRRRPAATVSVVADSPGPAVMTDPAAVEGYLRIAGPDWQNRVAARGLLTAWTYRPSTGARHIACPVLVQVADDDPTAPPEAAMKAAWNARAEVHHYPCDHFDVYPGAAWFDAAVSDQLAFLRRAAGGARPLSAQRPD